MDDFVPFDVGTPAQVFRSARAVARDGTGGGRRLYDVRTCTPDGGPVRAREGFQLSPDHALDALDDADTVVVAGIRGGPPMTDGTVDPKVAEALHRVVADGRRVLSVCTGAFVLAASGLLDGRPATTHWAHADRFRRLYPRVRLDPDVLFVDDGTILTSAGVGAGIDLCLHVVRCDHGTEVANHAARACVVPPWRSGGQSQFVERPVPAYGDATTGPVRAWALDHLAERLDLATMARQAGMSVRTFTRRFREETGLSPGAWLLQQRVERARHLLEATDLPVDRVARAAGFGTAASFRHHLRNALGVSPLAYRRTFRGTR